MEPVKLKRIVEAALLAADEPLTLDQLGKLFRPDEVDEGTLRTDLRDALNALTTEAAERGYELARVASGFRYQVRQELSPWISRLWEEKAPRYTRALLETLALVAYKQPVTRGDIEQVRGVSVSQSIMRTLIERNWIRVVGQREVPGRPAMYGTTREFLDYFNLKSLDQLPPLAEIRALIEPLILEEPEPSARTGDGDEPASDVAATEGAAAAELVTDDDDGDTPGLDNDAFDAELAAALARADAASARFRGADQSADEPADAKRAQVIDVVTDLDGEAEDPAEQPSAKVLQLPTSSH